MKKTLLIMMVIAMIAGMLAGCSSGSKPESSDEEGQINNNSDTQSGETSEDESTSEEKIIITFVNGFTGPDGEVMESIIDKYNKTNEVNAEVQLDRVSWDSLYQMLATSLPVGEGPDLTAFATERIGGYAESGALIPINDLYESGQVNAENISEVFNTNLQYGGDYYGAPVTLFSLALYYNKDLFDEAGVEYPSDDWTWDDMEAAALAMTKEVNGEQQYGFALATNNTIQMWPIMIWAGGGDFIKDGKSVFNSPENVATVTRWADLITNQGIGPATATGGEVDTLFSTGKLGMYFCGPWAAGIFDGAGVNYGIAGVPAGPGGKATLGQGVGMYMTSSADESKKEAIYDFFEYWQSVDTQVEWSGSVGFPVANTAAAADPRLADNKALAVFTEQVEYSHFYLQQLTNFATIDPDIIIPAMETILLKGSDVQATLDAASAQIDELIGN